MRTLFILPLLLLAAPTASTAPSFPLDFYGEICDTYSGQCTNQHLQIYDDGTVLDVDVNRPGVYHWIAPQKYFTAQFSDPLATWINATKDDGAPCLTGNWGTRSPYIGGPFWSCLQP